MNPANACPGRDVAPGDPHIFENGTCVFCLSADDRDDNLVYDDELPIWCESNSCDIETCHRCFPRKGCIDHKKCMEQGE